MAFLFLDPGLSAFPFFEFAKFTEFSSRSLLTTTFWLLVDLGLIFELMLGGGATGDFDLVSTDADDSDDREVVVVVVCLTGLFLYAVFLMVSIFPPLEMVTYPLDFQGIQQLMNPQR